MHIIIGAAGQVGSHIVKELSRLNIPARAITRSRNLKFGSNVEVRKANILYPLELTSALEGGNTVFLLTPENPTSSDIIKETEQIIQNYWQAIQVKK